MALASGTVWEVRTAGNNNNGGGFNAARSVNGVDRSQQDAAHITLTTATTVHTTTTQLNVPSGQYTVSNADLGNIVQITSGTATAGFYEITAVDTANNRWTVDRSAGTAGQTAGCSMGGAVADAGKIGGVVVTQNIIYIKSGTYTITSASTNVAGGCLSLAQIYVIGYGSTRDDYGTQPLLQADGVITSFTIVSMTNVRSTLRNVAVDGNSRTSSRGITLRGQGYRLKASNCTNAGIATSTGAQLEQCTVTGCSSQPAFLADTGACLTDCVAYDNTITGFSSASSSVSFVRCISDSNSGASSDGFLLGAYNQCLNCVAYNNGRDGFRVNDDLGICINCIAETNTGTGFNNPSNKDSVLWLNCATYNNGTATAIGTGKAGYASGAVTGSGSFFTNAASQDFSLNNTAGAGASCRAAGYPGVLPVGGTGYLDLGPLQHQDPAASGAKVHIIGR